ncbi:hypothetical protein ACHAXS_009497 [Conticribra weissflogii]
MKESKGKKRRRSAAAATATESSSSKAAQVDTAANQASARTVSDPPIKLSNRRKMKAQGKPKTDGLFLPKKTKAKNATATPASTSTPVPKRRKLDTASSTPEFESTQEDMQMDPKLSKATKGEATTKNERDDVILHISIFLSSSASSSSTPNSSETSPERIEEHNYKGDDSMAVERDNITTTTTTATKKDPIESISFLVTYIEKTNDLHENNNNNANFISQVTREDIAALLLPWSVARLMRWISTTESDCPSTGSSDKNTAKEDRMIFDLAWRALPSCFEHLSGSSSEETVLSNALSQGALMRLVPVALRVSFGQRRRKSSDNGSGYADEAEKESIDVAVQTYASNSFLHLARRFRPSLEMACKSLLSEVDELVIHLSTTASSPSPSDEENAANDDAVQSEFPRSCLRLPRHQARIAHATLEMIHNLMKNSNAKRSFGIISSTDVLPRLARLGMVEDEVTALVGEVPGVAVSHHKQLLKTILWDGLFHPAHHMDGFRTMGGLRVMPELPELSIDDDVMEESGTFGSVDEVAHDKHAKSDTRKKKGTKLCYQAGLFTSLSSTLSGESKAECEESVDPSRGRDMVALASILPLIIGGFFGRVRGGSAAPEMPPSSAGALTTTEADAQLQFRFWCHAIVPTVKKLFTLYAHSIARDEKLVLSLLMSVSDTLKQVLEYDAYLPSYNDPDEEHLSFLDHLTKGLQHCVRTEKNASTGKNSDAIDQKADAFISSFHYLLLLNHRLVHERLPDIIRYSCSQLHPSNHFNQSQKKPKCQANELLSSIIKTYRELRQIKHFLSCTRYAFHLSKVCQRESESMHRMLSCGNIVESLSTAYQVCPSGQIHEIWEFFDSWTVEITRQGDFIEDNAVGGVECDSSTELSFCVQMFIIFIKNVRTNKQNSSEVRTFSEKSMGSTVATLLGNDVSNHSINTRHNYSLRQGLNLSGWLVDIHTRACFWIENLHVSDHGSFFLLSQDASQNENLGVLAYLRNVVDTVEASDHYVDWKNSYLENYWQSASDKVRKEQMEDIKVPLPLRCSLQQLALHRIQQLHSMIYYNKLDEYERVERDDDNPLVVSNQLVNEAKTLVNFSLYLASFPADRSSSCIESESLWSPLVPSLGIWIQYSDSFHVDLFLVWFFSALCQTDVISMNGIIQLHRTDNATALSLLRDASFYDIHQLSASCFTVAIKFAMRHLIGSIDSMDNSSEMVLILRRTLSPGTDRALSDVNKILNQPSFVSRGHFNQNLSSIDNWDEISICLSFLASAPLELSISPANISLIEGLVTIDMIISNLMKNLKQERSSEWSKLEKTLSSNRCIITGILSRLLHDKRTISCLDILNDLLLYIFPDSNDNLILSTSDALSELFVFCVDHHEKDTTILQTFLNKLKVMIAGEAEDDIIFRIKATLSRAVLRRMNMILRRNYFVTKNASMSKKSAFDLFLEMTRILRRNMWNKVIRQISLKENASCSSAPSSALLLASEMLSFWGGCFHRVVNSDLLDKELRSTYKDDVVKVFELASSSYHQFPSDLEYFDSLKYFLASMAACSEYFLYCISPRAVIKTIMDLMKVSFVVKRDSPLLEAALCSLMKEAKLDRMDFITSYALKSSEEPAYATKIFFLSITLAKSQEQIKHVANLSKTFLAIMMGLVRRKYEDPLEESANISLYSKAATALISRKELLLLSGREIAMIMCEMSPVLFIEGRQKELVANDDFIVFKSCCSVVAALVAHYPKQLYGCPSPLFTFLLALLSHLLNTTLKTGLVPKAHEYAKVCELLIPHKDVFRKHVVGLILRYIQALNEAMTPVVKAKLMPSIYALLDMCSEFETKQINSMIDVPSKALFAPVFQSYQKYYQYHGQA